MTDLLYLSMIDYATTRFEVAMKVLYAALLLDTVGAKNGTAAMYLQKVIFIGLGFHGVVAVLADHIWLCGDLTMFFFEMALDSICWECVWACVDTTSVESAGRVSAVVEEIEWYGLEPSDIPED